MAKPDDSKPSEPAETIDEFFAKVGQHLGPAPTREEKLAALRLYVSEEEAQEELRLIDLEARADAAATREEKLAILREHLSEQKAQNLLHYLMNRDKGRDTDQAEADDASASEWAKVSGAQTKEIMMRLSTAGTGEEKLAVLRDYVSEEAAQAMLSRMTSKQKSDHAKPGMDR